MHFPWENWDTLLIGTDLSKSAVAAAHQGIYGSWSFRQVSGDIQHKYFCNHHNLFKINDNIKRRVKFSYGNLLTDSFPNRQGNLYDIDLILCRNVFIYLDGSAISRIIQKFHGTLFESGFLLTGHTELYGQDISHFQVLSFPESVVYKRRSLMHQATAHIRRSKKILFPLPNLNLVAWLIASLSGHQPPCGPCRMPTSHNRQLRPGHPRLKLPAKSHGTATWKRQKSYSGKKLITRQFRPQRRFSRPIPNVMPP
jgi:hypothetical protein